MRRYGALALLLALCTTCSKVQADADFSELSQTLEEFLTSGNSFRNITNLASLLGSSAATAAPSGSSSAIGLNSGTVLKNLAKVATVSSIVKKTDFWEDLKDTMYGAESLFTSLSLSHTHNLLALASDFMNGTAEVARDAWHGVKALEKELCTDGFAIEKAELPTACVGYNLTLAIGGGFCIFQEDKSIRCRKPTIRLVKTPSECFLKHHQATIIKSKECKVVKTWGKTKQGFLKPEEGPKTYNLTKASHGGGTLDDSGVLDAVAPMWDGVFSTLTSRLAKQYNMVQDSITSATDNLQAWIRRKVAVRIFS
ncbi:hypothetical protein F751_6448 [Auxenochlorella protothecoides]|uniref:Uncharacterized protein n=1 Tax=Auxenochlorella protothecoides TaxID=3075 RepID=A0A087SB35_AUXPR|nr:hypothetical protein F751_6448 [Auxenochlorella protothecoides]KFM22939.1 hypothetical protein F751_6448 [Auxenochlorella protothecoides]